MPNVHRWFRTDLYRANACPLTGTRLSHLGWGIILSGLFVLLAAMNGLAADTNAFCIIASPSRPVVIGIGRAGRALPFLNEFVQYYFTTRCGSLPLSPA
jgi:hypothetical protein